MREIIFLNEKPLYWTCPYCGANLDPGEKCDCDEARKDRGEKKMIKESNMYRSPNSIPNAWRKYGR